MGTFYSNPFTVINGARVTSEPMSGCHLPLTFSRDQAGWAAIWELVNLLLFGNICVLGSTIKVVFTFEMFLKHMQPNTFFHNI